MIKLIACDLDGTLLDPAGNVPHGTFSVIEKLYERGILFCVASGRQLATLEAMFAPIANKIIFAAENGALLSRNGQIFYCNTIPRQSVLLTLDKLRTLNHVYSLLCTPERAYFEDDASSFRRRVENSYFSNARHALNEIAETQAVCKISVYDEAGPENNAMKVLPQALSNLRVIQSGNDWIDISNKNANKGDAIETLQKDLSLRPEQCTAFGDYMNDTEMLLACGHPYVTENAHPFMKERFKKHVPSNRENGVLQALRTIADGNLP